MAETEPAKPPQPHRPPRKKSWRHRLNGWVVRRDAAHIFWAIAVLDCALILIIVLLWPLPQQARFTMEATTEALEVTVPAKAPAPSWATLAVAPSNPNPPEGAPAAPPTCPGQTLDLKGHFDGDLTAVFRAKANAIEVTLKTSGESLGALICPGKSTLAASDSAVVRFDEGGEAPVTLQLGGKVTLGEDPPSNSHAHHLLREGWIEVEAQSRPLPSGKVSAKTDLVLGDVVQFFTKSSATLADEADTYILVRLKDGALQVVGQTMAWQADVRRVGQAGASALIVAPSPMARLQAQAEWAIVLFIGGLAVNLLGALGVYIGATRDQREPAQ